MPKWILRLLPAFFVAALMVSSALAGEAAVAEPEGYRVDEYRSPVPGTLQGARVIGTQDAEDLWREKTAIFLDVMPRLAKPEKLPAGTIWRDKIRRDIPGSHWLANVGYGALTPEMEKYFRDSLTTLTSGDKSRKIVFYCMTNCWMSWNAAKRAVAWGYGAVTWYPDGADGWEIARLPLAEARPFTTP